MRLLATFRNEKNAEVLSAFLEKEGIDNQLEVQVNTDWGSSQYGDIESRIWVVEEDDLKAAFQWLDYFEENPDDPRFKESESPFVPFMKEAKPRPAPTTTLSAPEPIGNITFYLILACGLLFLFGRMMAPPFEPPPPGIPYTPLYASPIKKSLFYDYPKAYEIVDKIVAAYGVDALQNRATLPPEGQFLLREFFHTPFWQGMYDKIVLHLQDPQATWDFSAPMFEKIQQGEVWRLITPCLLHSDIFHLFFNMIWLFVLGKQIERRLGKGRYLLMILLTGIFSNTAQYMMTGPNFIGFSGVLCAMIMFVWARQRHAAWEGYHLQNATFAFIAFFVLAMFAMSAVSFLLEVTTGTGIAPNIANTAHLAGAFSGYLLGRMRLFNA